LMLSALLCKLSCSRLLPIALPPDLETAREALKAAIAELRQTEKNELRTGNL